MELVMLVEGKYGPGEDTVKGDLPKIFDDDQFKKTLKTYVPIMIVELVFRSTPERNQQGYGFRGRIELAFTSYALSKDELKTLYDQVQKDDMGDLINLVGGATDMSLDKLNEELSEYLKEEVDEKKDGKKDDKKTGSSENPFSALLSIFSWTSRTGAAKDSKDKKETEYDKVLRSQAIIKGRQECRKIYDMYKKAHNIPGF
jgi:hypothetical protein